MSDEEKKMASSDTRPESPHGVGESVTPQGNEAALHRSEEQRRKDREEAGVNSGRPILPEMPNLRPGDQSG